jgi:hypothetical protein
MDGNQSSAWYGSNPHRAQHIILGTNVKVDGLAISFSLPPGMSLSGSSDTASYTSVPFDNAWMATYQYNNLVARSLIGITGLHQTDSGTFRLNNNDYQTIASINFNLL